MLPAMFPIIEKLGGKDAVLAVLNERLPRPGGPRGPYTISKWVTDKRIPERCRWALIEECEARGEQYSLDDFSFQIRGDRPFVSEGAH